jgi:hypothetical protein
LHLRNSLILLEANIIKKIFNLQSLIIKHPCLELKINDLNICLDYSSKKLGIIAIWNQLKVKVNEKLVEAILKENKQKINKKSQII